VYHLSRHDAARVEPQYLYDTAWVRSSDVAGMMSEVALHRRYGDLGEHLLGVTNLATLLPLVGPDFGAVGGASDLRKIVGALLTYGLISAAMMVVLCAATWAIGSAQGSWQTASKAKAGLFVALGGAVLAGGALVWANWLLDVGATL